jgi:predicted DsbA family dithiol-disulfide isomerase
MRASFVVGVTGVPAFGWHGDAAVSGMMEPAEIERILRARLGDDESARSF